MSNLPQESIVIDRETKSFFTLLMAVYQMWDEASIKELNEPNFSKVIEESCLEASSDICAVKADLETILTLDNPDTFLRMFNLEAGSAELARAYIESLLSQIQASIAACGFDCDSYSALDPEKVVLILGRPLGKY